MKETTFGKYISHIYPQWSEMAYQYNTGRKFQHKQDLIAFFWGVYIQIEARINSFIQKGNQIPYKEINQLKFEFQQSFPKNGRVPGVNYFDDLLELLVEHLEDEHTDTKSILRKQKAAQKLISKINAVESERKKRIERELEKITVPIEAVKFLEKELTDYYANLSAVTISSSGTVQMLIPELKGKPFFADQYISEYLKYYRSKINEHTLKTSSKKAAQENEPKTFEDLFCNPKDAEICLDILKKLERPAINDSLQYIGNSKGIFPLWLSVIKSYNTKLLVKNQSDKTYARLLNLKIEGLNLSKDASEFRKQYSRLNTGNIELEIKTLLSQSSQLSQKGRLGK